MRRNISIIPSCSTEVTTEVTTATCVSRLQSQFENITPSSDTRPRAMSSQGFATLDLAQVDDAAASVFCHCITQSAAGSPDARRRVALHGLDPRLGGALRLPHPRRRSALRPLDGGRRIAFRLAHLHTSFRVKTLVFKSLVFWKLTLQSRTSKRFAPPCSGAASEPAIDRHCTELAVMCSTHRGPRATQHQRGHALAAFLHC